MKLKHGTIESLMAARKWTQAETRIKRELQLQPDNHWLWGQLSAARYQRYDYRAALKYAQKALVIMPECSLALWDKAEALYMLNRFADAIKAFKDITNRGIEGVHAEPCGESRRWARSLIADSYYRLGQLYEKISKRDLARRAVRKSLSMRKPGISSLYPVQDVRRTLRALESKEPSSQLPLRMERN